MATESDGWLERLKARVEDALASGNRRLDELEAEQERERADKPWLGADGDTPTLDQVRARIEWEEDRLSGDEADAGAGEDRGATGSGLPPGGVAGSRELPGTGDLLDPSAAEREALRIEMAERERASKERLARIREELGVEPPEDAGGPPGPA